MREAIDELNKLLNDTHEKCESIPNPVNEKINLEMDLGDFGNAVGIVVQKLIERNPDMDMEDFHHGFKHGVSLIDGTHG